MRRARALALTLTAAVLAMLSASCSEALSPSPALRSPPFEAVVIDVRSPERVPYTPSLLGTGPTSVAIVVTNNGPEPLDVSNLALRVEATRPGLTVECHDLDDPQLRAGAAANAARREEHDAQIIPPGASRVFERAVDCRLPLTGRYAVTVAVAFGRDRAWRVVRTYALDVTASSALEPRLVDPRGLMASIGSARFAGNAARRGHPRIGLALTNVSGGPIDFPFVRVETRVRRSDAPWSCTSTAAPLKAPSRLEAGSIHRESFEVACLGFDAPGAYDVEVVLLVGAEREISLGQLRIEIDEDPAFVLPAPIPAPIPAPMPAPIR